MRSGFFYTFLILLITSCQEKRSVANSVAEQDHAKKEPVTDPGQQTALFEKIIELTSIDNNQRNDSLAFLILPVEASCAACRKKAIDSILKHQDRIGRGHFIVISGNGRKKINYYFLDEGSSLPVNHPNIFVDSTDKALQKDLVYANPRIYYAHNGKVYEKVSCQPATIKNDLYQFFSRQLY